MSHLRQTMGTIPLVAIFASAALLVSLVATLTITRDTTAAVLLVAKPTLPYEYSASMYQAARATLCPGDTLAYTPTITIHTPTATEIYHLIEDVSTGLTLRGWEDHHTAAYSSPRVISPPERLVIPSMAETRRGGLFRMVGFRRPADGGPTSMYFVPFDVPGPGGCP